MYSWKNHARVGVVVVGALLAGALGLGESALADEWTSEDLGPRGIWKVPKQDPARLPQFIQRETSDLSRLPGHERDVIVATMNAERAKNAGLAETDSAITRSMVDSVLDGGSAGGESLLDNGVSPQDAARASQLATYRLAALALADEQKIGQWSVIGVFQRLRNKGFSLREKARKPAGYKNPATLAYSRDLVSDEEKLDIDFGLTWRQRSFWTLKRGANGVMTIGARPSVWVDGDMTTQKPSEENYWGGGAAVDFVWDCQGICADPCCGTVRWMVSVGGDWVRSQKGKRQRATAWVAAQAVVADIGMGFRKPIGAYETAPISFNWQPSVRIDYGRNIKGSTPYEPSTNFVRGTVSAYGTLYFDGLGRWVRGHCVNGGSLCKPGPNRKHDPYIQAEWEGYLLDQEEWRDWFQLSVVFPLPDEEGFQVLVAWEKGAQAPITFSHEEKFSIKFGVRF